MRVISGASERLPAGLYTKISRYRYKVFVQQLRWRLNTADESEVDQFDRPDTLYVAVENDRGDIAGCTRLLPTTRPYLTGEVFAHLLNGIEPPQDPQIWELSRFACMDFSGRAGIPLAQFSSSATAMLMRATVACAARHGAKRLIAVTPLGVERLIRRLGILAHRAGPPTMFDGAPIIAYWIEI